MSELNICISHRCLFPKGAYFYSTEKITEMVKKAGYKGVEFFPTWRILWEISRYRKLLAPQDMIVSAHRDWRQDRVMEAKLKGKPWWFYQLKNKEDWIFPPSGIALKVLQELQSLYGVPVSVAWFSDTKNFSPVMLELWSKDQGIDQEGLIKWLKEDSENRGVVIDTAKIDSWVESNSLTTKKDEVLDALLLHTFEVHFRGVKTGFRRALSIGGELSDKSLENLKMIINKGYSGRIVVEFGWPDLENSPFGLFSENSASFKKLHHQIVSFIRSI